MAVIPFQAPRILQGQAPSQRLTSLHAERLARYQTLRDFYQGRHFTARRPGRTQLMANYARAIADKHVAYTFARGVLFQGPEDDPNGPIEPALARILEATAFSRVLLQAGANATVLGDAVLKVIYAAAARLNLPEPAGRAAGGGRGWVATSGVRILNIDPSRFFPTFASDDPDQLRQVVVLSTITPDEARARYGLTLSRPGELLETWTADSLAVQVAAATVFQGLNPYGFIPFVHVPNLAPPGSPWGLSELEDLIPLNRELEDRLSDQSDTIRYHADPPVIFKGVREHSDLAVGPGTVWDVPADAQVDLLEWRGQAPAVDRHIERVLRALYDVGDAPRSSFGDTEQPFSGVALETQLQPIVQRTLRRRAVWEPALRRIAEYALRLAEQFDLDGATPGVYAPYRVRIRWLPMLPRDDDAEANRNIALTSAGLRSHRSAMEALGVLDPPSELQRVLDDRQQLGIIAQATPQESGAVLIPGAGRRSVG